MRKIYLLLFVVLVGITANAQRESAFVPGEILAQITNNDRVDELVQDLRIVEGVETNLQKVEVLSEHMRIWKFAFNPEIITAREMRAAFDQHALVDIVQYNHYVTLREAPDDPQYGQQWHHNDPQDNDIDSEEAWEITTGGTTAFGDEIVVCVIEGSNLNHTDLVDNKWVNEGEIPDNGIDDDGNGYIDDYEGWNVNSEDDNNVLQGGHGTSVSGMIGAKGNNGVGVSGINWDVKIMSVAGESLFDESSVIEAYNYPLQMRKLYNQSGGTEGAFVVATNASWGIDNGDPATIPLWCNFYDTLGTYGILNCGATANNNVDIDQVGDIPTACTSDYMISVTATNDNDVRTFSAYGETMVDLGAPGEDVVTTNGSSGYGPTSGTSFASPLTAGSIALIYSTPCPSFMALVQGDPQAGADYVRQVLFEGTDPVDNLDGECVTGGRLNVNNSIQLILNSCSDSECLAPFSLSAQAADTDDYLITWSAIGSAQSFNLRYRVAGDPEWIEVTGLTEPQYNLSDLLWCEAYEVEVMSVCEEGESDWTNTLTFETDGCCENPALESIVINSITETGAQITWNDVLAAQSYNVLVTPADGGSPIELNVDDTSIALSDLNACTIYEVQIAVECADESLEYTDAVTFNTVGCGACADLAFCTSFGSSDEEWIDRIQLEDIDNNSGNNGGYGDYTNTPDQTTALDPGQTYSVTLTPGFSGSEYSEYFKVWVDYNQDGEFSEDEVVFESDEASTEEVSGSFIVPVDAAQGSSRMRVSMKFIGFFGAPQEACDELEFGEVEDYCLEITDNIVGISETGRLTWNVYPNPANDVLNISLPTGTFDVEVRDMTGRLVAQQPTQGNAVISLDNVQTGVYLVQVLSEGRTIGTQRVIVR